VPFKNGQVVILDVALFQWRGPRWQRPQLPGAAFVRPQMRQPSRDGRDAVSTARTFGLH